jgi:uncharacterized protein (TIGR03086 family)
VSATVEQYREVLGILRGQIAALGPDDLTKQTPCSEWDALALVAHTLGAMAYYAHLARGDDNVRPVIVDLEPGDDLVQRFDDAAAHGVEAWSRPGALDSQVKMVLGRMRGRDALAVHIGDLALHAWDLGNARGIALDLPPALVADVLATWEEVFLRLDRGTAFAAEVEVEVGASPTARLVAYCGRTP